MKMLCINRSNIHRLGFTLVELLVVISIIALMTTIAIVSLGSARQNARDIKRVADLRQIRLALSMYYNDNGYYPPSPCGYDCIGYYNSFDADWTTSAFATALSPYLKNLPKDPINSPCGPWTNSSVCYSYAYGNVGRYANPITYDLATRLENPNSLERCGIKDWTWGLGLYGTSQHWCFAYGGDYNNQMYEMQPSDR